MAILKTMKVYKPKRNLSTKEKIDDDNRKMKRLIIIVICFNTLVLLFNLYLYLHKNNLL